MYWCEGLGQRQPQLSGSPAHAYALVPGGKAKRDRSQLSQGHKSGTMASPACIHGQRELVGEICLASLWALGLFIIAQKILF